MDDPSPSHTSSDPTGSTPQKTSIKKFIFRCKTDTYHQSPLTVTIPERMDASYGLYVWPSAHLLSWYLFQNRESLRNKRVLELGAGTGLPSIVAALCGAQVTLSDSSKLPHCLEQGRKSVEANGLENTVQVIGLTWGLFLAEIFKVKDLDLIIGSDCFYDPTVFEDLLSTVAYLLQNNPKAKFLTAYQERSSDWSISTLLSKWGLESTQILYNDLANSCDIDLPKLLQGHTIHLFQISLKRSV